MIPAALLIEILDLALIAARIPTLMVQLRYARAEIAKMVREGREPTKAEMDILMNRLRDARNRLQR